MPLTPSHGVMNTPNSFVDFVLERLCRLGGISARRMFGGHGIFYDGLMVGLIVNDIFYLKVDAENRPRFEEAGSRPFTYQRKTSKKPIELSYWEVPVSLYDNLSELENWTRDSHAAAQRSKAKKKRGT